MSADVAVETPPETTGSAPGTGLVNNGTRYEPTVNSHSDEVTRSICTRIFPRHSSAREATGYTIAIVMR